MFGLWDTDECRGAFLFLVAGFIGSNSLLQMHESLCCLEEVRQYFSIHLFKKIN